MEWGWYWETPTRLRVFGEVTVRTWFIEYGHQDGQKAAIALLPSLKEQIAKDLDCPVERINAVQIKVNPNPFGYE